MKSEKYAGEYECELILIRYSFEEAHGDDEPLDYEVEIVACISGDIESKINSWADKHGYKIVKYEEIDEIVRFVELLL